MPTDEVLIQAWQEGDRAAYETLVRRYWTRVFTFARRMVGEDALAEDVLSSTFMKLFRGGASYRRGTRFTTFLFTIAYREAITVLRARQRYEPRSRVEEDNSETGSPAISEAIDPESAATQSQTLQALDRALRLLPDTQRAAFLMFYREGLSVNDIAEGLGISAGSVRAYLTYARATLRTELTAMEEPVVFKTASRR
jgi:RNA polymerase sigma-70 factor (ECF subfamily)